MMNIQRAKDISQSPHMENITHLGQQVYIKDVDEQNKTATVFPLDHREKEMTVNISQLKEN